jgi:hypothetical protein
VNQPAENTLIEKIKGLRPERIAEVEDFVDFLKARDEERGLTLAAGSLAEESLRKIWDNADDADYDRL